MLSEEDVASQVQALLVEKLFVNVESHETDLLATGILDSLTLVQLLMHLEERFGLRVAVGGVGDQEVPSLPPIPRLVTRPEPPCAALRMPRTGGGCKAAHDPPWQCHTSLH